MKLSQLPKTIFLDIDGTILKHRGTLDQMVGDENPEATEGTIKKMAEWNALGHRVIITTARPITMREETVLQLKKVRATYHVLLMDCSPGVRVLVNDYKPWSTEPTAIGITIARDSGLGQLDV